MRDETHAALRLLAMSIRRMWYSASGHMAAGLPSLRPVPIGADKVSNIDFRINMPASRHIGLFVWILCSPRTWM
jgi:hypothetical protein